MKKSKCSPWQKLLRGPLTPQFSSLYIPYKIKKYTQNMRWWVNAARRPQVILGWYKILRFSILNIKLSYGMYVNRKNYVKLLCRRIPCMNISIIPVFIFLSQILVCAIAIWTAVKLDMYYGIVLYYKKTRTFCIHLHVRLIWIPHMSFYTYCRKRFENKVFFGTHVSVHKHISCVHMTT